MQLGTPLPSWAMALVALAVVGLALVAYRHAAGLRPAQRGLLIGLRAAALSLVILCLLRPMVLVPPPDRQDGVVAVLVDGSRSMGLRDAEGLTRIERAGALLTRDIVPALSSRFRVESFVFGDRLTPAGDAALAATGDRTDLADAVRGVVERHRGQGLSAIIVLSDGNDTSGADLEATGRAAGVPVIAIGLGRTDGADREVVALATGQSSLDASLVDLTATLSARHLPGGFDVRLLQNGQVVERRAVTPASDGAPMRVVFTVAPDRNAPTVYTIDIPATEAELTPANNQARAMVPPPGRRRLLLSLEGAPGFEQTFLKRAWSDDPSLEVDAAVRKGRNEQGADTFFVQAGGARASTLVTGFPSTREALFAYDAVVLADYDLHLLSREAQEWLRAFVSERGGGLLFAGARTFDAQGLASSPLEELLPLRLGDGGGVVRAASTSAEDRYRVRPTAEGTRHPMMRIAATDQEARSRWANLPSLAGVVQLGSARPGASVLAVMDEPGSNAPVVAVQRFGAGRTALFAGQASWRWKMLRPAADGSYDRFWRQTARWLTADALEPITATPPGSVLPGDPVELPIVVRTAAYAPSPQDELRVRVEGPDGKAIDIIPSLTDPARGLFTARVPSGRAWHLPGRSGPHHRLVDLGSHRIAMAGRWAGPRAGRSAAQRTRLAPPGRRFGRPLRHRRAGRCGCRLGHPGGSRREPAAGVARRLAHRMDVPVDCAPGLGRVGPSAPLGAPMSRVRLVACVLTGLLWATPLLAENRYALVIAGAPGGEAFISTYSTWVQQLSSAFIEHLAFPADHVIVLSGTSKDERQHSTQQNVRAAIARLRQEVQKEDLLVILLVGHGTVDDGLAKFNLMGPDLTSEEWGTLLADLPGRVIVVNTSGGSFPFLRDLAAPWPHRRDRHRVDGAAVRHRLSGAPDCRAARPGGRPGQERARVGVGAVRAHEQERRRALRTPGPARHRTRPARRHGRWHGHRGRGHRRGRRAGPGDLSRARRGSVDADPELTELLGRRRSLEEQAERLKQRKATMPIETWEREFEALMIDLARVSRRIRSRS